MRYEAGELKGVADQQGQPWAEDVVHTAGEPAALAATADRAEIRADGDDLAFVSVRVVDAHGRSVPRSAVPIRFEVAGPAEIVATDNGDPTDFTPFPSHERRAFKGLCLVIVRGRRGSPGAIELRAEAPPLRAAAVRAAQRRPLTGHAACFRIGRATLPPP